MVHIDCFNIVQRIASEQTTDEDQDTISFTLRRIWLAGYWSRTWTKALYNSPPPPCPAILSGIIGSTTDLGLLIQKLASLPPELRQIIATYSYEAPLWRLIAASSWPFSIFGKVIYSSSMTVSLDKLGSTWRRGSAFKAHVPRSSNYIFVKFVLDCDGIKAVDLLPSIPKYRPQQTYGGLEICVLSSRYVENSCFKWLLMLLGWPTPSPTSSRLHSMGHS
jgi:hypothetical protein